MITIYLENDKVYLHGTPEESAGTEIRGCLELDFEENTRVKSIQLEFTGLLKLNWEEGTTIGSRRRQHKIKKTIYKHHWTFLPSKKWPYTMESNTTYRYPFDLVVPGHIAESIDEGNGYGSLGYEFKAVVTRPLSTKNWVVHRPIHIIRHQSLELHGITGWNDDDDDNGNRVMNQTFRDKANYRIELDKSNYQRGQPIRVHFTFTPLLQGLRIKHISCFLKEYTTLAHPINELTTTLQEYDTDRIISIARNTQFPCHGLKWQRTETLVIPRSTQAVQYDTDHPLVRIRHKLRFTICFIQPHGQISELRVTMPIKLLDTIATTTNTSNPTVVATPQDCLPRYEEACLTAPYNPQRPFWSSSLISLPSLLNDCPSPSYDSLDDPHMVTPPDRAPATATTTGSCDYFSYQPADPQASSYHIPSYSTLQSLH